MHPSDQEPREGAHRGRRIYFFPFLLPDSSIELSGEEAELQAEMPEKVPLEVSFHAVMQGEAWREKQK